MMPRTAQGGSALVLVAGMGLCLLAFMGLVADTGVLALEKGKLQRAADAAALAGALGLATDQAEAARQAEVYILANGAAVAPGGVQFPGAQTVRVDLDEQVPLLLSAILGRSSWDVGATSVARWQEINVPGARPFAIPDTHFVAGGTYELKAGPHNGSTGNYRALAIDASGTPPYVDAILLGAVATVSVGDWLSTEPGNMEGPTETAIDDLIATTSAAVGRVVADHFDCSVDQICNPATCPRVVTTVLVDPLTYYDATGKSPVQVSGFARFYLVGAGSNGEVYGKFLTKLTESRVPGRVKRNVSRLVQ